jgi:hypothetical protein
MTTISSRLERLMVLPFAADPRASWPRPLRRALPPQASLAGVPPVLRDRIGRNVESTAFPYAQALQGPGDFEWRDFNVVEIANARWRVVVCPDLGGRVLQIVDRRRQRDLLLQPAVLNQGVIGLTGAWFIGGIEFNAFRFGHNIHGLSTIRAERRVLADGQPAIWFGATDELYGCQWSVMLALGEEQVFLRVRLENLSDAPQPDYWWTTIAVAAHRHTRVLGAPGPMLHHGMFRAGYQHDQWPRLHGRDWSRWREHHEILSGYLYQNSSDFFGTIDADGYGFVHQADHRICRGRKLWSIGAGRDDVIWSDRLLEPASTSYLELQSGRHPLQVECGQFAPGEVLEWTESIGALQLEVSPDQDDYGSLFAHFSSHAERRLAAEYRSRCDAAGWVSSEAAELSPAAPRVELSRRIVESPGSVTAEEIEAATMQGWVAGAHWRRRLADLEREGRLSGGARLASAAAALDAGEVNEAVERLRPLMVTEDETGGWASLLLGLQQRERRHLERAARLLPGRPEVRLALDQLLAVEGRHHERRRIWDDLPETVRQRDDVRIARAAGALARGEWVEVRGVLTAPLPAIPEGSVLPWLIYRESFVGEAFELMLAGKPETASRLLYLAGAPAPQFGVGRDEAGWGLDLLYYRWRLALAAKRTLEADLLLAQAARLEPYAGSIAGAYWLRWLCEAQHPAVEVWKTKLANWDEEAGEGSDSHLPLRAVVLRALRGAGPAAWGVLRGDPLYGHRATFESGLLIL